VIDELQLVFTALTRETLIESRLKEFSMIITHCDGHRKL